MGKAEIVNVHEIVKIHRCNIQLFDCSATQLQPFIIPFTKISVGPMGAGGIRQAKCFPGYSKIKCRSKPINEAISDLSSAPLFGVFSGVFLGKRYVRIGGDKD